MKVFRKQFPVRTSHRCQMRDITSEVASAVRESGIRSGDVVVFCPHTTAAITINENADPSVTHDILLTLGEMVPELRKGYQHSEGNSDAHVKSSLIGCSETIIIENGSLVLGTWQGIYFCEFDGPRSRSVIVQVRGE
ncbi:MAG TPA: secondary thiamine-phosphate synthase enzyme YjbQ [Sedimentisphaerales bacterium]|nr:secondary thiamine-phosphate synthase enzyme YjbQ [Sedimentisphaerales bacterium]